jgi:oligogalacturonide transport system permease protein
MEVISEMKNKKKILINGAIYTFLIVFGIIMVYPLIWLFFSSFKPNEEIFGSLALFPKHIVWDSYYNGWKGNIQFSFGLFFFNTLKLVIPVVLFTILSCSIVAYGFARFKFPLKKILFGVMISTLMLPNAVIIIPRYIIFRNLHWVDTYLPFTVPAIFACYPFFIFMFVQFFRGIPRELDESAVVDGCGSFRIFWQILMPLSKPVIFSAGIFQFIWTWNDFFNSLIFINSVKKFTVSLGLRMSLDITAAANWNEIMAMSIVSIIPCVLIFFFAQRYFIEGIATTGLKG